MNRAMLELQEVDNVLTALARAVAHLDDGTQARGARDTLQLAVHEAVVKSQATSAQRAVRELELQSAEEKIARQQSRLMNASSAHEITALQRDIEALGRARSDLDEAILNLMDEGETASLHLASLEAQLKDARAQAERVEAHFSREAARLEGELAQTRQQRVAAQARLSPAEGEKYAVFAKKFGGVAVASVVKGNCSACGAAILTFTLREAKNQEFPTCEGCGRLIFVA